MTTIKITFDDWGQSFREWHVDENGIIQDCRPYQFGIWYGLHVKDHTDLKPGDRAMVCRMKKHYRAVNIPIKNIERIQL